MKRALLALVLGCLVPVIALAIPTLNVTPSNLDFGQVDINTTSSLPITVQNLDATDTVYVEYIQLYDNTASFRPSYPGLAVAFSPNFYFLNSSYTANSPIPILPGESRSISIDFTPGYMGQTGGILFVYWFYSDHIYPGVSPLSVTFAGEGVDPAAPPSPPSGNWWDDAVVGIAFPSNYIPSVVDGETVYDLDNVVRGQTLNIPVTITNTGTGDGASWGVDFRGETGISSSLNISGGNGVTVEDIGFNRYVSFSGNDPDWGLRIHPGESFTFNFSFSPVTVGPWSTTIQFMFLAGNEMENIVLSAMVVEPPPVVVTPTPPPPPPEVPGVDFFCITADQQTSLGGRFYLTFFGVEVANPTWDFGDGSTGAGIAPAHFYAMPGEYTVKLAATNARDGVRYERERVLRFPEKAGPAVEYMTGNLRLQILSGPTDTYNYRARYLASGAETNITIPGDANIIGSRQKITAGRKITVTRYMEVPDGLVAADLTVGNKGMTVSAAPAGGARSAKIAGVQSSSWGAIKANVLQE